VQTEDLLVEVIKQLEENPPDLAGAMTRNWPCGTLPAVDNEREVVENEFAE